jgi:hypothetical protein
MHVATSTVAPSMESLSLLLVKSMLLQLKPSTKPQLKSFVASLASIPNITMNCRRPSNSLVSWTNLLAPTSSKLVITQNYHAPPSHGWDKLSPNENVTNSRPFDPLSSSKVEEIYQLLVLPRTPPNIVLLREL